MREQRNKFSRQLKMVTLCVPQAEIRLYDVKRFDATTLKAVGYRLGYLTVGTNFFAAGSALSPKYS